MSQINFHRINKLYESGVHAIKDVSFDIDGQEFIVLVGPSGCGKSTLLRMLAGLEEITTGKIVIDGKIINEIPPKDRNISMVFQNYALYPHLTVYDNIAFGLRLKKVEESVYDQDGNIKGHKKVNIPREEIDKKVHEVAEQLELTDYLSRKPNQLSGGQKQRVALARALVRENDIFLLDEPLSNLDAKLRVDMRKTIKSLHNSVKKPFVYVTHDQVEAMTLADKIVVLKKGVVQQIGSPKEIYDEPNNLFVATFFGSPAMGIINGTLLRDEDGRLGVKIANGDVLYIQKELEGQLLDSSLINQPVKVGLRPTSFKINPKDKLDHYSLIHGEVIHRELFGSETLIKIRFAEGEELLAFVPNNADIQDKIELYAHTTNMKIFDPQSEKTIFGLAKDSIFKHIKYRVNENHLNLTIGGKEYCYPLENRLIDQDTASGLLIVSVMNNYVSLEKSDKALEIEGQVSLVKNLFQRNALFIKVDDQEEPLVAFVKKEDEHQVGEKIKVYLPYEYIDFIDEESGLTLLSKYEIHNELNDNDLKIMQEQLPGYDLSRGVTLRDIKIYHRKDKINKKEYYLFKVKLLDVENHDNHSIIYYRLKGMKGYLTAFVNENVDMVTNPTLTLMIKR